MEILNQDMESIHLFSCGDCLELLKDVADASIDMVLCDLPYGVTKNKWDSVIPLDKLWNEYKRVCKPNAAIILFADGMFEAELMKSNPKMWKYNLVWDKVLTSGFLNANRMPLRSHEEICVFYQKPPTYNPQKTVGAKNHSKGKPKQNQNNDYGEYGFVDNSEKLGNLKHPTSILRFSKPHPSTVIHPTQKPVDLLEYLIRTYSNEGDVVLDNCMGSGSTGVAAINTGRRFVGFELDNGYYLKALNRIAKETNVFKPRLEPQRMQQCMEGTA